MAVDGIAEAKDVAFGVLLCIALIDSPYRLVLRLDFNGIIRNKFFHATHDFCLGCFDFRSRGMAYQYDHPLGPWLDESRNPQHTEVWLRPVRPSQDVEQACRRLHQM